MQAANVAHEEARERVRAAERAVMLLEDEVEMALLE